MELKEKIVSFLGDSITEGVGVENCTEKRYDNIIKKKGKLKESYNYGIGGTRLAHQIIPSEKPRWDLCFCGRAYNLYKKSDIIVVYGGVNDYIHGDAPFGQIGDKTPATFCGGVEFLMNILPELYPQAKIIFMTPAHCMHGGISDNMPSGNKNKADDAKPLYEYVNIIEKTAKLHNINVLNLFERLPINPNISEDFEKYTVDGLHFNENGHAVLADLLLSFIENEI